jgi:hypothetical protein
MQAKKFAKRNTGQTFFGISNRFDLAHKSFKYVSRMGARRRRHSAEHEVRQRIS